MAEPLPAARPLWFSQCDPRLGSAPPYAPSLPKARSPEVPTALQGAVRKVLGVLATSERRNPADARRNAQYPLFPYEPITRLL